LKRGLNRTGSQWRDWRDVEMWSNFLIRQIKRANRSHWCFPLRLTSIKKLWETRNDLRIVAWKFFSMEKLNRSLYRKCSVKYFYRFTPFRINAETNLSWPARLSLLHVTVCCKPRDCPRQKPRWTQRFFVNQSAKRPLRSGSLNSFVAMFSEGV